MGTAGLLARPSRALRYVDLNPVWAKIVEQAADYEWSSAQAHVTGRDPAGLLDLDVWRELCPLQDWAGVLQESPALDKGWAVQLRNATRCGKPLGNKDFINDLESKNQADLKIRRPGRPPKKDATSTTARVAHAS